MLAVASLLVGAPALAAAAETQTTPGASVASFPVSAPPTATQAAPSSTVSAPVAIAPAPVEQPRPVAAIAEPDSPTGFAKAFPRSSTEDQGVENAPAKRSRSSSRSLAAMLDAGLPDGAVVGLAYRPAFWTRLQAGVGYNSISPGVRAGVVLVPFSEGPSLTVEGGYYAEGDANSIISNFAGSAYSKTRTLQKVGYQFVNFHAGLDFGSTFVTFFLHGGMTYLHTTLHDANDVFGGQTVSSQGEVTTYTFNQDVSLKLWFPSCKLGLLIYIV